MPNLRSTFNACTRMWHISTPLGATNLANLVHDCNQAKQQRSVCRCGNTRSKTNEWARQAHNPEPDSRTAESLSSGAPHYWRLVLPNVQYIGLTPAAASAPGTAGARREARGRAAAAAGTQRTRPRRQVIIHQRRQPPMPAARRLGALRMQYCSLSAGSPERRPAGSRQHCETARSRNSFLCRFMCNAHATAGCSDIWQEPPCSG